MEFEAPLPEEFQQVLDKLRAKYGGTLVEATLQEEE
jgi:hypothetical protein